MKITNLASRLTSTVLAAAMLLTPSVSLALTSNSSGTTRTTATEPTSPGTDKDTETTAQKIAKAKKEAKNYIDNRVNTLTELKKDLSDAKDYTKKVQKINEDRASFNNAINSPISAMKPRENWYLPDASRTQLIGDINGDISTLKKLRTRIDDNNSLASLNDTINDIKKNYATYGFRVPQVKYMVFGERVNYVNGLVSNWVAGPLQTFVNGLEPGTDKTEVTDIITGMQTKLGTASQEIAEAEDGLLKLNASTYRGTDDQSLKAYEAKIADSFAQTYSAWQDGGKLIEAVKGAAARSALGNTAKRTFVHYENLMSQAYSSGNTARLKQVANVATTPAFADNLRKNNSYASLMCGTKNFKIQVQGTNATKDKAQIVGTFTGDTANGSFSATMKTDKYLIDSLTCTNN